MPPEVSASRPWFLYGFIALVVVPAVIAGLYLWAALHFSYSTGDRVGYLQKLSRKGWVFKTWEGEIAMITLPGTSPEIFYFSVRDPNVVTQLQSYVGQRVAVTYQEHRGLPGNIFGESRYFIASAKPAGNTL